jgi:hypothetical protein
MRPVVGITTYVVPAKWAYWEQDAALIPIAYVRAVERAGARALLVPPSEEGVDETLDAPPTATAPSWLCSPRRSSATCRCSPSAAASRC